MAIVADSSFTLTGTADADLIVGVHISGAFNQTISGGNGNDVIFADHDAFRLDPGSANATRATATNIDAVGIWSTKTNPDIGDVAVPYTTVLSLGTNTVDVFAVTVGLGETITIDLDHGFGGIGGVGFDSLVRLETFAGTLLGENDDSAVTDGGAGSRESGNPGLTRDSFLTYTNTSGQTTLYITVDHYLGGGVPAGATYMLNVSVTGHANSNDADFGPDSVDGGEGDDILYGVDGADTLSGGGGNDTINGGAGADSLDGGAGTADALSYEGAGAGVTVDLRFSVASGPDTVAGFENLIGSGFGDNLFANNDNNRIEGGGGNDFLGGFGGLDTILGGTGNDDISVFDYALAATGSQFDGGADVDTFTAEFYEMSPLVDVTGYTITNFERLSFLENAETSAISFRIGAAAFSQFTTIEVRTVVVRATTLEITMGGVQSLDLGTRTFTGFDTGDRVSVIGDGDNETITGGSENDSIDGAGGHDSLGGGLGNDTLAGGEGNDTVQGGAGGDSLDGGAGTADTLSYAGSDAGVQVNINLGTAASDDPLNDTIAGFENLIGSAFDDVLVADLTNNRIEGGGGNDRLAGLNGLDTVMGGAGNDRVEVTLLNRPESGSQFEGGDDIDTLRLSLNSADTQLDLTGYTITGFETLSVEETLGAPTRVMIGAAAFGQFTTVEIQELAPRTTTLEITMGLELSLDLGTRTFTGFGSGDRVSVIGNGDNEAIVGASVSDSIDAGAGSDTVFASVGNDTLDGGADSDTLDFSGLGAAITVSLGKTVLQNTLAGGLDLITGFEAAIGSAFNDTFQGGAASEVLSGGGGNDLIIGGSGNDLMLGGAGNDVLRAGVGADTFEGGDNVDLVDYSTGSTIRVDLEDNAQNAVAAAGDELFDVENVAGGIGHDTISGDNDTNRLVGNGGNDTLRGRDGLDQLEGGLGNDRLEGGTGADVLVGGAGNDLFVFDLAPAAGGIDRTNDYVAADDQIVIDASAFGGGLVAGGAVQFVAGAAPSAAGFVGGVFLYNTGNGFLSFDADGGGAGAAVAFFRLQNFPVGFGAADFTVVA